MLLEILLHHNLSADRAQIATQRVAAGLQRPETAERKIFISRYALCARIGLQRVSFMLGTAKRVRSLSKILLPARLEN
jgi:hypothetical protein